MLQSPHTSSFNGNSVSFAIWAMLFVLNFITHTKTTHSDKKDVSILNILKYSAIAYYISFYSENPVLAH